MTEVVPGSKARPDIIGSIQDMARIGQPAVDYIVLALGDRDLHVRIAAISALADIADEHSFWHIRNLMSDREMAVRLAAASSLGNLGDEASIQSLFPLCRDECNSVRTAAREAIEKIIRRNRLLKN